MYVSGQGHVGVTTMWVIVVHHVKTLILFITFLTQFNFMTMVSEHDRTLPVLG